jgi:two-component system response regulator PilR (NtrC family)
VGKILVVDDEQSMREFLGICLRRAGHEVTLARNGVEALDQLRGQPIDIVVSDLRMPGGVDGLGILKAIKAGEIQRAVIPGTVPTPIDPEVILVTAFATADRARTTT